MLPGAHLKEGERMKKEAFRMDYRQVKERVANEKAALPALVIETGIGMLIFFLAWIFLGR
jgi:hypothetical protein